MLDQAVTRADRGWNEQVMLPIICQRNTARSLCDITVYLERKSWTFTISWIFTASQEMRIVVRNHRFCVRSHISCVYCAYVCLCMQASTSAFLHPQQQSKKRAVQMACLFIHCRFAAWGAGFSPCKPIQVRVRT